MELFKAGFSPLRLDFYSLRVVIPEQEHRRLLAEHDPSRDPTTLQNTFPQYR